MKNMIMVLSLFVAVSAMAAEKVVLECTTKGDALDYVQLVEDSTGKASMKIGQMSEEVTTLQLMSSLQSIEAGEADTIVAAKDLNSTFGGAVMDAALIRVLPGQKSARLAANGVVYFLTCSKK